MTLDDFETELAARRAIVAQANARLCPQCGQPIVIADTPAQRSCAHCGQPITIADTPAQWATTTSTGTRVEPVYITAGPPAPGPVSVPSVFGTSPLAHQATCPTCGQKMPASTPAADPPASTAKDVLPHAGGITDPTFYDASGDRGVVTAPPKKTYESWRDREPLL